MPDPLVDTMKMHAGLKTVVVILQMGKVGSWTIVTTLQAAHPGLRLATISDADADGDCIVHTHSTEEVANWLGTKARDVEAIIVGAVRDPLRNSISMFFQNMANREHLATEWRYLYLGTPDEILMMPTEAIVRYYHDHVAFPSLCRFERFADRFGAILRCNPYAFEFDQNGLACDYFKGGRYAVLQVHRFADALPALGRMLHLDISVPTIANVATEKWYGAKYAEFLAMFSPTNAELDAFYGSRFARGSFSAGDLAAFRSHWRKDA